MKATGPLLFGFLSLFLILEVVQRVAALSFPLTVVPLAALLEEHLLYFHSLVEDSEVAAMLCFTFSPSPGLVKLLALSN